MGYRSLVVNKVRKAFDLVKDLAIEVTLTQKDTTGFNFGTAENNMSTPVITVVKAVVVTSDKTSAEKGTITKEVLLKSEDVNDITLYDKITINGIVWSINFPHKDDGYVTTLNIYRES
jgi:hypothetical protein